ncbi:ABC transporter substrate-binding protein [Stomatohabitans albus]|uniref:ABC transporter substrate-binding protein n=1 Tax=Stomatohabitans albus TaxID=3110766 RepID=UPI00300CA6B7
MSSFAKTLSLWVLSTGLAALTLTGCGQAQPNPSDSSATQSSASPSAEATSSASVASTTSEASSGPITLTNCGNEITYDGQVSHIVATSNSANVGTLLRIGAADKLAAATLRKDNDDVLTALYGPGIENVPRLENPISMETIVSTNPDLLIGSFSGLFSGSSGVTVEAANDNGVPTYIISDSCRQDPAAGSASKLGTMDPWDAVRSDIENYGKLTGNTDEAAKALEEFNARLDELKNAPQPEKKPKILLFDSGTDELYTSGHNGPPQGIIDVAGGINVFEDQDTTWFKASWEAVATTEPDVIVVLDYRKGDADEIPNKIKTIQTQPALANLDVVKENRIIVLPLVLFTSGYPNIEAAVQVRKGLEDLGLVPASDLNAAMPASFGYGAQQAQ